MKIVDKTKHTISKNSMLKMSELSSFYTKNKEYKDNINQLCGKGTRVSEWILDGDKYSKKFELIEDNILAVFNIVLFINVVIAMIISKWFTGLFIPIFIILTEIEVLGVSVVRAITVEKNNSLFAKIPAIKAARAYYQEVLNVQSELRDIDVSMDKINALINEFRRLHSIINKEDFNLEELTVQEYDMLTINQEANGDIVNVSFNINASFLPEAYMENTMSMMRRLGISIQE